MSWEIGENGLATYGGVGGALSDYLVGEDDDDDLLLELLGAQDMVGGGQASLLGASPFQEVLTRAVAKNRRRKAQRSRVTRKRDETARVVERKEPSKSREWPLGFDSVTTIAGLGTVAVTSQPQVIFRPDRIIVPSSIASDFLINDIKVGQKSQFISSDPVPAVTFQETAFGVRLMMDTAQISQDVTMNVTNTSGGPLRFNATMIGPIVE